MVGAEAIVELYPNLASRNGCISQLLCGPQGTEVVLSIAPAGIGKLWDQQRVKRIGKPAELTGHRLLPALVHGHPLPLGDPEGCSQTNSHTRLSGESHKHLDKSTLRLPGLPVTNLVRHLRHTVDKRRRRKAPGYHYKIKIV